MRNLQPCVIVCFVIALITLTIGSGNAHTADEWHAVKHDGHANCQAGEISGGDVGFSGEGYKYLLHDMDIFHHTCTDIDCHSIINDGHDDVSETTFTHEWILEKYDVDHWTEVLGSTDNICQSITLCLDEEVNIPDRLYVFTLNVDDTPSDGPYGDDEPDTRYSDTRTIYLSRLTSFAHDSEFPEDDVICIPDAQGEPRYYDEPGGFMEKYNWEADCGTGVDHHPHLKFVTFREKVTFESQYTNNGIHNHSHGGANCFNWTTTDPFYSGGVASGGNTYDSFACGPISTPYKTSSCMANQVYQWAANWPTAPALDDTTCTWTTAETHTVEFIVLQDEGTWYKVVEHGDPDGHSNAAPLN